jgi:hypothetical protein
MVSRVTEDEFWERVAALDGSVEESAFDRLTAELAHGSMEALVGFAGQLDQALRRLDLLALQAQHVWDTEDDLLTDPPPLDWDGFLDARAAVVCAGREMYQRVLADPSAFAGIWDFSAEMLLYVPVEAYEAKTGRPWPYQLPGTDETIEQIAAHRHDTPDGHGPDVVAGLAEEVAAQDSAESPEESPADATEDAESAEPLPMHAQPTSSAVRLDVRRHAFWLVEVTGAHDLEPVEGFLADPAPAFAIPAGAEAAVDWPEVCVERAFPAASARITEVFRAHGGLPPLPVRRMTVVLMLAAEWDLTLRLRPYSGAVHVPPGAVHGWSPEQATCAVTGLAAHVLLEAIDDYRVEHAAVPALRELRDAAIGLVPFR